MTFSQHCITVFGDIDEDYERNRIEEEANRLGEQRERELTVARE